MIVNTIVLSAIGIFILYCILSALPIGHNEFAPTLWARLGVRWRAWVKRNIVDYDPYDSEPTIDEVNRKRRK